MQKVHVLEVGSSKMLADKPYEKDKVCCLIIKYKCPLYIRN